MAPSLIFSVRSFFSDLDICGPVVDSETVSQQLTPGTARDCRWRNRSAITVEPATVLVGTPGTGRRAGRGVTHRVRATQHVPVGGAESNRTSRCR